MQPIFIPAFLNVELKDEKLLCPIRALSYYLDLYKDLLVIESYCSFLTGKAKKLISRRKPYLHG
jgi:hypothetical protein